MTSTDGNNDRGFDSKAELWRFVGMMVHFVPMWLVAFIGMAVCCALLPLTRLLKSRPTVILYASQDQVFAEPILRNFARESGIRVRTVFDSEAAKTVAIANRLLAERAHPQCDVFWGNEELRTRQLAAAGLFRPTNGWAAFGYRSRRIAMASGASSNSPPLRSLVDLTNAVWRGRVAMAYPLFGTTATHLIALRQYWGESNWLSWCRALAANTPWIVDGNSAAARFAARGQAAIALTDSDDIAAEIREGAQLEMLPMTAETLLIPNTVAVLRGCPHPAAAQSLYVYLQRPDVVAELVAVHAMEGASRADVPIPTLQPDWDAMLRDLETATDQMQRLFRR
ncbi:MAG: iron(III) transport system substrate-binding protein [Verrucomicrobiota bacterium]